MTRPKSSDHQRRLELGRRGEDLAAQLMQSQGWTILDRNWRCDIGELDIIARDRDCLVVCEVKTRSSALFGGPIEAVSERKVRRLRRLALRWLEEHRIYAPSIRFDVVGVTLTPTGNLVAEHVRGVE